ncbi:dihydroorotase [Bacillus sp. FJAT-45037]|uniref:dihydroorotase n=1 Tax=Bacillus sp. FJAT-45037 TaxID=2011007 RepID=UPI000C23B465|nr:dihydroorotase [Bacillus sp. FJAT-45037]
MITTLKNGFILTENGDLTQQDISFKNGVIINDVAKGSDVFVIDVSNKLVTPGFIDLHIHLREPGGEKKETIETGTMAAARGGFTTVAAMPNTRPTPDTKEQLEWLHERISQTAYVRVLPYAAITTRLLGRELTDFDELKEAGAFAFTDDGVGVQSAAMMLEAMRKAAALNMSVVAHCEENTLIQNGCVHEGQFSKEHGLRGIPSVCESVHIARDVLLAEAAGVHYHVCHISTKESVRVVRNAKRAGINVTAEVTPHHLLLCEEDITINDANFKMNPPLRSKADQQALLEGLQDGTIDFIATDHAPHTSDEKAQGMDLAPFGIVGLETAFTLLHTHLVETGHITLHQLINWLTVAPGKAFGLDTGELKAGNEADLCIIDLEHIEAINPEHFASKGTNTPFAGWETKGWPVMTFVGGKLVWEKERVKQ